MFKDKKDKAPGKPAQRPGPSSVPRTKEEAIKQMVERDPEKAAQLLREILKSK